MRRLQLATRLAEQPAETDRSESCQSRGGMAARQLDADADARGDLDTALYSTPPFKSMKTLDRRGRSSREIRPDALSDRSIASRNR